MPTKSSDELLQEFAEAAAADPVAYEALELFMKTREQPNPDECCGTCEWWEYDKEYESAGDCKYSLDLFTIPNSIEVERHQKDRADTGCPCWHKKESK